MDLLPLLASLDVGDYVSLFQLLFGFWQFLDGRNIRETTSIQSDGCVDANRTA